MKGPAVTNKDLAPLYQLIKELRELAERVEVLEERTCSHESRLEDLENWQDKIEDKKL